MTGNNVTGFESAFSQALESLEGLSFNFQSPINGLVLSGIGETGQ